MHSLKHGAQVNFQAVIISLKLAPDIASRHRSSIVRLEDVVHPSQQLSHLFKPQKIKEIARVFPEMGVFVKQAYSL